MNPENTIPKSDLSDRSDKSVKFTPGPWKYVRVKEDIDTFAIRTETDDTLAAVGISPVGWRPGKDIANATLIAAAPEMFTALAGICQEKSAHICQYRPESCEVCQINKVLKKARGEQ